jgi:hypothetical protein
VLAAREAETLIPIVGSRRARNDGIEKTVKAALGDERTMCTGR